MGRLGFPGRPGRFRPVWPVGLATAYVVHWSFKGSNLDEGFLGHIVPDGKWAKAVVTDIRLPSPSR
jgi:hypothetical protein